MVYELISLFGEKYFDENIRDSLYAGIMTDTGSFARRLSPKTLIIAQNLINNGVNYERLIRACYSHRTLYELKALAILIEELKYENFHYVVMDKSLLCFKRV